MIRIWKKSLWVMLGALFFLTILIGCVMPSQVFAGVVSSRWIDDKFDSDEINLDYWTTQGETGIEERIQLKTSGGSQMQFLSGNPDTAAVYTKQMFQVPFSVSFDFQGSMEGWFGFSAMRPSNEALGGAFYDNLLFGFTKDAFGEMFGYLSADKLTSGNGYNHNAALLFAKMFGSDNLTNIPLRVKFDFRAVDDDVVMDVYMDTLVDVTTLEPKEESEINMTELRGTYSGLKGIQKQGTKGGNPTTDTGAFAFAPSSDAVTNTIIKNFKVVKNDETVFEDDFSGSGIDSSKWNYMDTASAYVKCGTTKSLNFTGKTGDMLVSTHEASVKLSEKVFELEYDVMADALNGTAKFGVLFGLTDETTQTVNTEGVPYIYLAKGKLGLLKGGLPVAEVNEVDIADFTADTVHVKMVGYSDRSIKVFIDGEEKAVFTDALADGKFAFAPFSDLETNSLDVCIDNVVYIDYEYKVPETKSLSHNFNTDYLDETDWFLYQEPAGSVSISDGQLVFSNASDKTSFGTKYVYDDFILRFDLTDVKVLPTGGPNNVANSYWWIGVHFGTKDYGFTDASAGKLIYFRISTDTNPDPVLSGAEGPQVGTRMTFNALGFEPVVTQQRECPDWFGRNFDPEDPINFKFVAENNTMSVYMKRSSDISFGDPYIVFEDVETTGAVAITNTGWASYSIDNFSIVHTGDFATIPNVNAPEVGGTEDDDDDQNTPIVNPGTTEIYYEPNAGGNVVLAAVIAGVICLVVGVGGTILVWKLTRKKD